MKKLLLILLFPLLSFGQDFNNIYYNPTNTVNISDDFYAEPDQEAVILASKESYSPFANPFRKGKVVSSFESSSDINALYEYKWKSDYLIRPGKQTKDALVKGVNGKYYIIRWQ